MSFFRNYLDYKPSSYWYDWDSQVWETLVTESQRLNGVLIISQICSSLWCSPPCIYFPFYITFCICLIILSTQKWCQYSRKLAPCWTSEQTWRFFWSVPLASLKKSWVGAAPVTVRFLFVTADFQATSKNRSRIANWFTWVNKIIKALHRVGLTIT